MNPLQPPDADEEPFTTYFDSKIPIPDGETVRARRDDPLGAASPGCHFPPRPGTGDLSPGVSRPQSSERQNLLESRKTCRLRRRGPRCFVHYRGSGGRSRAGRCRRGGTVPLGF